MTHYYASRLLRCLVCSACLLTSAAPLGAATLPPGFSETVFTSGLTNPTAMQFAPDGRLFVCEQGGALRVIKNGQLLAAVFVDIAVDDEGERGLLGVAFDPSFAANQYVYVYYTARTTPRRNRISRFTANGDVAVAGSEFLVMELDPLIPDNKNHNGGALAFGPDGKLYVAVGENGYAENAQMLSNRHGKMLRINADGSIPADNPTAFGNVSGAPVGANRAIWAVGLRNPFTFAFNPGATGPAMLINDVGAGAFEEINDGIVGANYGWPLDEGPETPPDPDLVGPRYFYDHGGGRCAITGGAFYVPATPLFPGDYLNAYFFADYCAGWIRRLQTSNNGVTDFATGIDGPVDLKVWQDGALYYLARGAGQVYRVAYGGPGISTHPANTLVTPGQTATFSVVASGGGPFTYQWLRNGSNIAGATGSSYTTPITTLADNGARFRVRVTNTIDSVLSNEAVLTVSSNQAPTATIVQPTAGLLYSGGQTIAFAGTGTDPEDGPRPASAFSWRVDFHHDAHSHPFLPATSGITGGTFVIGTTGHTETNVWYRVFLTVTDSGGRTHTVQRDIHPRVVSLTLRTSPAGLQLRLDGQPVTTPHVFTSVAGVVRTIDALDQTVGTIGHGFLSWADGGAHGRAIVTPPVNTTYTAWFRTVAATGPPDPPTGFAMIANGQSVQLSWNRVPGATSYLLEAGTTSGLSDLGSADVGDVDRIQGLVPPGSYFARVRAVNPFGASAASSQASLTITSAATCVTPPPLPANYSAQTGGLVVALTWSASPGATDYQLEVGASPGLANLGVVGVGDVTGVVTTAPAGTYYTRLRALNACGASAASVEVPVTLGCSPTAVVPWGLTVTNGGGTAQFSWLPPLGATSYRIRVGTAPGASNLLDMDVGAVTSLSASLAGVPPGLYYVRVAAVSACGVGADSNEVPVSVP